MRTQPSRFHRLRQRSGFTLVELLVVIGIIAVLIGVLLPVLSSARKSAYKVKCASQLREIGNALKLYAVDNKNYWPVAVHWTQPGFPLDPSLQSVPDRRDYWYQFLLKYFTNRKYTDTPGKRLADFQNTPLWGCPAVQKDVDLSASSAEYDSGYGFNMLPTFSQTKGLGSNAGPWSAMINPNGSGIQGKYYKMNQWVNPAEKIIIADSRSWIMETRSVASVAAIVHPKTNSEFAAIGYDGGASHQFDRWRHSKKRGLKQPYSMNGLFCDGHVSELGGIEEMFRAIRGHFPQ
jgi:prepilin-type N-terminal cleavage/methylation domain-containing protein/prepilin-type processing-associated H-X9-DG protein